MQIRTMRDEVTLDLSEGNGIEVNEHNEIIISLTSAQTSQMSGYYRYDLELTDANNVVTTIAKGKVVVEKDQAR